MTWKPTDEMWHAAHDAGYAKDLGGVWHSGQEAKGFYTVPQIAWKCILAGDGETNSLVLYVHSAPNWFWRKMQYLALGIRWVRNTDA